MRRAALIVAFTLIPMFLFTGSPAAGGGCHGTGDPTSGRGDKKASVVMEECMFTPTVVYVDPGDEVTWVNHDSTPHAVTGVSMSWGDHNNIPKGDAVAYSFESEGVFPYYCLFHPSMVGAVVVGDPSASKAVAAPMDTDVEAVTELPDESKPEIAAAPASSSADEGGAPWLHMLVIAMLLAAGVAVQTVRSSTGGLPAGRTKAGSTRHLQD